MDYLVGWMNWELLRVPVSSSKKEGHFLVIGTAPNKFSSYASCHRSLSRNKEGTNKWIERVSARSHRG